MIPDSDFWIDALQRAAENGLRWVIRLDGDRAAMPAGHNGPYFDIESPVRNTAHWLVTFSILYRLTGEGRYRATARQLARFLREPSCYLGDAVYTHRQKGRKDTCNGVIGQAWLIEALHRSASYVDDPDSAASAARLGRRLPFDGVLGAWQRVDAQGRTLGVDFTYNHQAWFAAAKAESSRERANEINRFLDASLAGAFRTRPDGLIAHVFYGATARALVTRGRHALSERRRPQAVREKELGYHLYVLFALARLHSAVPEHPFFESGSFRSAVLLAFEDRFQEALLPNPYAYPYNAPGFELLRIAIEFRRVAKHGRCCLSVARQAYERQLEHTFCGEVGLHVRRTPDPCTLAARVYELALGVECLLQP